VIKTLEYVWWRNGREVASRFGVLEIDVFLGMSFMFKCLAWRCIFSIGIKMG
jgi:hypothetical protein